MAKSTANDTISDITITFTREEADAALQAIKAGDAAGGLPLRDNRLAALNKLEAAIDKIKHPDQPEPKANPATETPFRDAKAKHRG
jgi:hypothetical protein